MSGQHVVDRSIDCEFRVPPPGVSTYVVDTRSLLLSRRETLGGIRNVIEAESGTVVGSRGFANT